jgi:cupin 2 domain-containing protein
MGHVSSERRDWSIESELDHFRSSMSHNDPFSNFLPGNIFANLPDSIPEELFQEIGQVDGLRIERIISMGQATPEGQWYDQAQDEWVLLLSGSAGLRFAPEASELEAFELEASELEDTVRSLYPGDFINIPAHRRHRVDWTDPNGKTIWLAVHYGGL